MSTSVGVDLGLNAQDYINQAGLAAAASSSLQSQLGGLAVATAVLGRGWDNAAPKRSHIALLGGFTAAAAQSQQMLSGFSATQAVTGQRTEALGRSVRQLARDMPIGTQAALATTASFTQMGLSMRGQERQVASLARTMAQLQGANGGAAPQYAASMTQLERTFGDQGIDPKRVSATADSLTTVSKVMGANAQSVLDFTNAIGPLAQAAGIGKTPTLGIAAAFSRIGQDGNYAATAVNKILTDMTQSVAGGGGGNLATYANIVGTTADNFERLFKANPAQAITQVTQAIGAAGNQGPAMLNRLGLEGIRTQQALQAVSASGGLQGAINTAVGAYGSGSTQRAANAAFGGVLDNFSKAGTAAGQLGVALGTPILRPLGAFASVLSRLAGGVAGAANTRVGGDVANVLGIGALGAVAARRLFGIAGGVAAARQIGTSGPIGSFVYQMRREMGAPIARDAEGNIVGVGRPGQAYYRTAGYMGRATEEGTIGQGMIMGGLNTRAGGMGSAFGIHRAASRAARSEGLMNRAADAEARFGYDHPLTQRYLADAQAAEEGTYRTGVLGRASRVAGTFAMGYSNVVRGGFDMAAEPDPMKRQEAFNRRMRAGLPTGATRGVWTAFRGGGIASGPEGETAAAERGVQSGLKQFNANLAESGKRFPSFLRGLMSIGGMYGAGVGAVGGAAEAGASGAAGMGRAALLRQGIGGLASGAAGFLTSPMVLGMAAIAGGGYLVNQFMHRNAATNAQSTALQGASPTSAIDKYNEALGLATTNTEGFSETLANSGKAAANSINSMADALNPRSPGVQAILSSSSKVVQAYPAQATNPQIAAQIQQSSPGGMSPAQVAGINADLQRQYGASRAGQILKLLNVGGGGQFGGTAGDIRTLVQSAAAVPVAESGNPDSPHISESQMYSALGSLGRNPKLKQSAADVITTLTGGIGQTFAQQTQTTSPGYAQQGRLRSIQEAMKAAGQSGNELVFKDLSDAFEKQFGLTKMPRITSSEERKEGGYVNALMRRSPQFKAMVEQWTKPTDQGGYGLTLTGTGASAAATLSPVARQMQPFGALAPFFNNTLRAPQEYGPSNLTSRNVTGGQVFRASRALQDTLGFTDVSSGDPMKKTQLAVEGVVTASTKAGTSLTDLATQANKAAAANGDVTSSTYQRLQAIQQEANFRQGNVTATLAPGQQIAQNMKQDVANIAAGPGTTADTKQTYQNARQDLAAQTQNLQSEVDNQLEIQRNYQIQSHRAQQDYTLQVSQANQDFTTQQTYAYQDYVKQRLYAQQDYQRQSYQSARDFNTQQTRAAQDYQTQVTRSNQQYYIQRGRAQRDFNIQSQQAEQDYEISVSRAIRDFNTQLGRQIDQQTRSLYDPYKRIQTQAVWDAHQLLANMTEQNQAIQKQTDQLASARKMGLSNAAITQLDLNNPQNAQQLAMLMNNFLSDPKLISQINQSVSQRTTLGKVLVTDPSNVEMAQAKQDLATQLSDMSKNFNLATARNKQQFRQTLADQAKDYSITMSQGLADYERTMHRSQSDYNTAMADSAYVYGVSMARMDDQYATSSDRATHQFETQMSRMALAYSTQMSRMHEDTINAQKTITVDLTHLWGVAEDLVKGKTVDTNKFMRTGLSDTVAFIKSQGNAKSLQQAYKNIYPYDLGNLFKGGPDDAHMPKSGEGLARGGPYAMYMNGGQRLANSLFGGSGAALTQGFGDHSAGAPHTGGGWPVSGATQTQQFGDNKSAGNPGGHPGIDLAVPTGTPISSPLPGVVVFAGWNDGYGNCTIVDNGGGRSTLFGHQQRTVARAGQKVRAGDLIGYVDSTGNSTGPHLHFETRVNGMVQNPAIDLPIWEATAGLGSFDPGATAAAYGVGSQIDQRDQLKANLKKYSGKNLGPFGSYLQLDFALQDLASQVQSAGSLQNVVGNILSGQQSGPLQDYAKKLLAKYGWNDQWADFDYVEMREAGWDVHALNKSSGAYGLAQALPASKYSSAGPDWQNNGYTQLDWMMAYIKSVYGDPRGAAAHERALNWYGTGYVTNGPTQLGGGAGAGERGREALIPLNAGGVTMLAQAFGQAVSADQLRSIATSGAGDRVTYVSQLTQEDHSVNFDVEHLEVVDPDPLSMARKMETAARQRRLTKSPSRGNS